MSFKELDIAEIESMKESYASEGKERWGNTEAYNESARKIAQYDKAKWKFKAHKIIFFSVCRKAWINDPITPTCRRS